VVEVVYIKELMANQEDPMKAVIMAGGFGTRLKPLTNKLPKPMVPVVNRPMMEHILLLLRKHRIHDITSLLFYHPEKIQGYFQDGSNWGVYMRYVVAEEDFGTAGSVKNAEDFLNDRFLVISGDVLTDFDLSQAVDFHLEKKSLLTLVLTRVSNPLPFGVVIVNDRGEIVRFLEKPTWGQVFSDTVNTGIYIIEPEILEYIPSRTNFDFSKDLFPLLMQKGIKLYGYIAEGYWKDVGDLREYQTAQIDCLEGRVKVDFKGRQKKLGAGTMWVGENCQIAEDIICERTVVVGDHCVIEEGARLSRSVIGDGCRIGPNATIRDSVLWEGVTVGQNVTLLSDVIANDTEIGSDSYFEDNVFVSDHCRIGKRTAIRANVKIWPDKRIEDGAVLSSSLVWGDRWLSEIFTGSRVSGVVNAEVSPEFGAKLGAAFGGYLGKGNYVVTSRDVAESSRMINRSLICGFMSAGLNVQDLRITPIPIVRYELRTGREKGGIHVRRSPHDDRKVDIIFFDADGRDLPVNKTKAIERLFMQEDFPRASYGEVGKLDFPVRVMESYNEGFINHLDVKAIEQARLKVVVDYSYSSSSLILPSILGSLDCEVISLNAYLDSQRIPRRWEDFRYALLQLSNIVTSLRADVGFLIDVGAESLYVVDEKGHFINSDLLLVLVTKLYLDVYQPRRIAVPVTASREVDRLAAERGVEVLHTRNEHRAMIEASLTDKAEFVGGTRGGFIFSDFHFACDGMFAMAKILELIAKSQMRLGELSEKIRRPLMGRKEVNCPWVAKGQVMRHLMEYAQNFQTELIDGVKIFMDDAWVLVIPDKEAALFQIVAEAPSRAEVDRLIAEFEEKILRWQR